MKIEITTGQTVIVNNIPAVIDSIHPEHPSKVTTIHFTYTEAPYAGISKTIEIINN